MSEGKAAIFFDGQDVVNYTPKPKRIFWFLKGTDWQPTLWRFLGRLARNKYISARGWTIAIFQVDNSNLRECDGNWNATLSVSNAKTYNLRDAIDKGIISMDEVINTNWAVEAYSHSDNNEIEFEVKSIPVDMTLEELRQSSQWGKLP